MDRKAERRHVFFKFLFIGLVATVPWVYWLQSNLQEFKSSINMLKIAFASVLETPDRISGFSAKEIPFESGDELPQGVFFIPRIDAPHYRAAAQIFRVIEQHYVDSKRLVPEVLLGSGLQVLQQFLLSQYSRTLTYARFFATSDLPLDSSSNLMVNFVFCLNSMEPKPQNCGRSEYNALKDSPLAGHQVIVFHIKETSESLFVTLNEKNGSNKVEERLAEVSASVLQWLKDVNLDPEETIFRLFVNQILHVLDPHSSFLDEEEYEDLRGGTRGQFGGVGVVINEFHGLPFVREIVANSPAQMAGIEPNDILIRVGSYNVTYSALEDILSAIRKSTRVGPLPAWFFRPHSGRVYQTFFSREEVPTRSVEERFIPEEPDVLHLRVSGFSSRTSQEIYDAFMAALKRRRGSLKAVILDLRGNPGGLLDQAVQVSDLFLSEGKIVVTKSRYDIQTEYASANQLIGLPLVVLMNSSSASASEIVAGAIKDSGRGIIVGERSFGKGSVQSLFEIPKFGALKMTIAHYYTPSEKSIQGMGIQPHVELRLAQPKNGNIWVAGGSEKRREEDLQFHLDNPQKSSDGAAVSPIKTFENNPSHWVWAYTQDALSNFGFLGQLSFTYPNYENSDHVTHVTEDAYVRVALKLLKGVTGSKDGQWPIEENFSGPIEEIRRVENLALARSFKHPEASRNFEIFFEDQDLGDTAKPLEECMVFLSEDPILVPKKFNIEVWPQRSYQSPKGVPQKTAKINKFRTLGVLVPCKWNRSKAVQQAMIGFALAGHTEQPSAWQLVELNRKDSGDSQNPMVLKGTFAPSELFYSGWSALREADDSEVEVYLKLEPRFPGIRVLSWNPDMKFMALDQVNVNPQVSIVKRSPVGGRVFGAAATNTFDGSTQDYAVHVEFESVSALRSPCKVILAPMVNRGVVISNLESSCSHASFRVQLTQEMGMNHSFEGIVGFLLQDNLGVIKAKASLLEIEGGVLKGINSDE